MPEISKVLKWLLDTQANPIWFDHKHWIQVSLRQIPESPTPVLWITINHIDVDGGCPDADRALKRKKIVDALGFEPPEYEHKDFNLNSENEKFCDIACADRILFYLNSEFMVDSDFDKHNGAFVLENNIIRGGRAAATKKWKRPASGSKE